MENLLAPSLRTRLRADAEAGRGTGRAVSSSSLPVQRRFPAHLSAIAATPSRVSVTGRAAIRTSDRGFGFARFLGAPDVAGRGRALTLTVSALAPARPAVLITVRVAECGPGVEKE